MWLSFSKNSHFCRFYLKMSLTTDADNLIKLGFGFGKKDRYFHEFFWCESGGFQGDKFISRNGKKPDLGHSFGKIGGAAIAFTREIQGLGEGSWQSIAVIQRQFLQAIQRDYHLSINAN
ncbi:MAG: hypothetical protein ACKO23_17130 [Gemmataceae bacterium]